MDCAARSKDFERKRRQASESMYEMSKSTRARIFLALRDAVKEASIADPDLTEDEKVDAKKSIDDIWEDVVLVAEFHIQAGLHHGRAEADYEENESYGHKPLGCSLQHFRAWFLYKLCPFDKSLHGKMQSKSFKFLCLVSVFPIFAVRHVFFIVLLLMHLTNLPPDTFQLMAFITSYKGTEFIAGGVLTLLFMFVEYVLCIKPGDPHCCQTNGPGMNIWISLSFADMLLSAIIPWIAFLCIGRSRSHLSAFEESYKKDEAEGLTTMPLEIEGVSDMMSMMLPTNKSDSGTSSPAPQPPPPSSHGGLFRLAGARRMFKLLLLDLIFLVFAFLLGCWMSYLDLAVIAAGYPPASTAGAFASSASAAPAGSGGISWAMIAVYWTTPAARGAWFKARVCYHMLTLPFAPLMSPALATLVALIKPTGYNKNGYCMPFTLRPVRTPSRTCGVGGCTGRG